MENTPETTAVDGGLPRRTVLAGAAWTIPVIAAATITPTASASGTLQLAFDKTTYNGTACSTITGAYVTATTNGVATTGASITVSLSNGYTFSGGSTSATGLSGTNGRYIVPDINVPSTGDSGTASANGGGTNISAALSAIGSFGYFDSSNAYHAAGTTVPTNSTLAPGSWALTPDGKLIALSTGAIIRTGVASLGPVSQGWFGVINTDGSYGYFDSSNAYHAAGTTVPTNSTLAPGSWARTPDGKLIALSTGAIIRTGVASLGPVSQGWFGVINTDGSYGYFDSSNAYHAAGTTVPTNSTLAPGSWARTPDGKLIALGNGAIIRTGVASLGPVSQGWFGVINTDGSYGYFDSSNAYHAAGTTVPTNSTLAPGSWALTPDGKLIALGNGAIIRTGVASLGPVSQGWFGVANRTTC